MSDVEKMRKMIGILAKKGLQQNEEIQFLDEIIKEFEAQIEHVSVLRSQVDELEAKNERLKDLLCQVIGNEKRGYQGYAFTLLQKGAKKLILAIARELKSDNLTRFGIVANKKEGE
jgi:cell division septum initiation protein DivIVA